MLAHKDIEKVQVIGNSVKLNIDRGNLIGTEQLNINITANWSFSAVRNDWRGVKSKVNYILKSNVVQGEIEFEIIVDLNREATKEELEQKEAQKLIVLFSASHFVQWVSDITSRMGVSPLIIDLKFVENLITSSK